METSALWHLNTEKSIIKPGHLPRINSNQVLIESRYSLISAGTEKSIAQGFISEKHQPFMQVPYMDGSFSLPIKYGYSVVGKVISEGKYLDRRVHLMHPHQSLIVADIGNVYFISDQLYYSKAALLSNMETIVNAIWDAEISNNEEVLICGFGGIGFLLAETIRMLKSAVVTILDTDDARISLAHKRGFETMMLNDLRREHFATAFNCSGTYGGLNNCIKAVGFEGKVIELSWYGDEMGLVDLGGSFHFNRKKIISSQVSNIPLGKKETWTFVKRKKYAEEVLNQLDLSSYGVNRIPFAEAPQFFEKLRNNDIPEDLIHVIDYIV